MSIKPTSDLTNNLEDAWVSCWMHSVRRPGLKRLPPRLWEELRIRLQRVYHDATGEDMATLEVQEPPHG